MDTISIFEVGIWNVNFIEHWSINYNCHNFSLSSFHFQIYSVSELFWHATIEFLFRVWTTKEARMLQTNLTWCNEFVVIPFDIASELFRTLNEGAISPKLRNLYIQQSP